jgi:hypothetical protein
MSQQQPAPAGPSTDGEIAGTAELREEIERTRRDLGDTVEALAAKTDVKARAREAADRMRADLSRRGRKVSDRARTVPKGPVIATGATGLTLAAVIVVGRRLTSRHPGALAMRRRQGARAMRRGRAMAMRKASRGWSIGR